MAAAAPAVPAEAPKSRFSLPTITIQVPSSLKGLAEKTRTALTSSTTYFSEKSKASVQATQPYLQAARPYVPVALAALVATSAATVGYLQYTKRRA